MIITSDRCPPKPNHRDIHRRFPWVLACVLLGMVVFTCVGAFAQNQKALPPPSELKKLSVEELMNIEVTSVSKRPEKLSETPSAIQVITQEDIRRSGATSIPEALRLASNLHVAQIDSRQWAISARGFNGTAANKLLVMIDGRTVYTPLYSGVFWDVQDVLLEDIERIEVISGPGATLWGANAVNGVINITTKNAKHTQGLLAMGAAGTELRDFSAIRYGGKAAPNLHYRLYGKFQERDSTEFGSGLSGMNSWSLGQGGFRLDWDKSKTENLTLQGDHYEGSFGQPKNGSIGVSGSNVIGRWSRALSDTSDLKVQLYYDHTHRNIPGTFVEDLDTFDFDLQHRLAIGERHDVVWGFGFRQIVDDVTNSAALAFLPPSVTRQWFSAFAQDEIALIHDRLLLTLGTKVEHNDYTGFEFQPSGRVVLKLSPRQTLWGAISRAVRTPSRIDRELFAPGNPPFLLAGGPGFASESVVSYELGYHTRPHPRLILSLAAFYSNYDNIRSVEKLNPPAAMPIVIGNGLNGESYGAELTADYRVSNSWQLHAGYTNVEVTLWPKPGSTDTTGGSSESHDPNHQFFLRSSLDLKSHVALDAMVRYVSRIPNQNLRAYAEMDLRLGWSPKPHLELSIVGQNLLHTRHAEFGASINRQYVERSVYGKILCHF